MTVPIKQVNYLGVIIFWTLLSWLIAAVIFSVASLSAYLINGKLTYNLSTVYQYMIIPALLIGIINAFLLWDERKNDKKYPKKGPE